MTQVVIRNKPDRRKKYRKTQLNKGLVRFEIQVREDTKTKFDEIVSAVAEEYVAPYSKHQRYAKAKTEVFEQITQGVIREFYGLKDDIEQLQTEIRHLTPSYFKDPNTQDIPLPATIKTLSDDSKNLKAILANQHRENFELKSTTSKLKSTEKHLRMNLNRAERTAEALEAEYNRLKTSLIECYEILDRQNIPHRKIKLLGNYEPVEID